MRTRVYWAIGHWVNVHSIIRLISTRRDGRFPVWTNEERRREYHRYARSFKYLLASRRYGHIWDGYLRTKLRLASSLGKIENISSYRSSRTRLYLRVILIAEPTQNLDYRGEKMRVRMRGIRIFEPLYVRSVSRNLRAICDGKWVIITG